MKDRTVILIFAAALIGMIIGLPTPDNGQRTAESPSPAATTAATAPAQQPEVATGRPPTSFGDPATGGITSAVGTAEVIASSALTGSGKLESPEDFLALADPKAASHRAAKSGAWSDPTIWSSNAVPGAGARVHIPEQIDVLLEHQNTEHLDTVRVDGSLRFSSKVDTELRVDTLVVANSGLLEIGTPQDPVGAGIEALLSITALDGPEDDDETLETVDHPPLMYSQGTVTMHGTPKTSMAPLEFAPDQGDRELVLEAPPQNWAPGDLIVVSGSRIDRDEEKALEVNYVDGTRIGIKAVGEDGTTWTGLENDYGIREDLKSFVINVSRNVGIASETTDGSSTVESGSLYFQGDGVAGTSLNYVGSYGLGSSISDDDPGAVTDANKAIQFIDGSSDGTAQIVGLALVNGPESGLHINNSDVQIIDSVAYDNAGGALLTDAGAPTRLLWQPERKITRIPTGSLRQSD